MTIYIQYRTAIAKVVCTFILITSISANSFSATEDSKENTPTPNLISMKVSNTCDEGYTTEASPIIIAAVSALVPRLVDLGISYSAKKLEEKASSYSVGYAAQSTSNYTVSEGESEGEIEVGFPRCILIYGGDGGKWGKKDNKDIYPQFLRNGDVKPQLLFELELGIEAHNPYGIFYRLMPQRLVINEKSRKATQDIVLEFTLDIPDGPIKGGSSITSLIPPITNVKSGRLYSFDGSVTSKWEPLPTPKDVKSVSSVPISFSAVINNTKNGEGAYLFSELSKLLAESKKEIVDAVKKELEDESNESEKTSDSEK